MQADRKYICQVSFRQIHIVTPVLLHDNSHGTGMGHTFNIVQETNPKMHCVNSVKFDDIALA